MDRNNSRYPYVVRRQGTQQSHQHQSSSMLTSSTATSPYSNSNNNHHLENHRNSSGSGSSSSSSSLQYSSSGGSAYSAPSAMSREPLTQHDELIRYIREAWTKVNDQGAPVIYRKESDHQLKNFKPFNLEEYWGQRLVQNINVSHSHQ